MTDLEARLGDALKGVRDAHTESYRAEMPALRRRVVERVRRRRIFYVGSAVAGAVAAAVVVALVLPAEMGGRDALPPAGRVSVTNIDLPGRDSFRRISGTRSSVYVQSFEALYEIDPRTNEVDRIQQPRARSRQVTFTDIAATPHGLLRVGWTGDLPIYDLSEVRTRAWVEGVDTNDDRLLFRHRYTNEAPQVIVSAGDEAWLSTWGRHAVWRLDARTGRILQRIQTFPRPGVIQATTHDVWFVTHTEKFSGLSHFEVTPSESDAAPEAADLPPPAPASVPAGECPTDVALEAGAVWVVDACSSELLRFDSETLNRERIIPLPEAEVAGYALEGALGYVWVADRARSTVLRVDATTSEVVGAPIKVGREPNDMTVGAGALWVVTSRGVSRIDIMSVDESISPSETDAATSAPETPTPEPTLPAGLRPRDFQKSFSMWPEQSLGSSKTACAERSSEESWRESPEGVASQFALEMLNWTGTTAMEGPPQGRMVPLVVQSGEVDAPAVGVHVRQVPGQSCWAVVAVTSDPDNDQDPGVSYSRDGANVELHFDIGEATTAVGTVHHEGGRVIHSTADDESPIRVDLGYRPSTPGYYLLVLRDENGTVFDAEGRPLD